MLFWFKKKIQNKWLTSGSFFLRIFLRNRFYTDLKILIISIFSDLYPCIYYILNIFILFFNFVVWGPVVFLFVKTVICYPRKIKLMMMKIENLPKLNCARQACVAQIRSHICSMPLIHITKIQNPMFKLLNNKTFRRNKALALILSVKIFSTCWWQFDTILLRKGSVAA